MVHPPCTPHQRQARADDCQPRWRLPGIPLLRQRFIEDQGTNSRPRTIGEARPCTACLGEDQGAGLAAARTPAGHGIRQLAHLQRGGGRAGGRAASSRPATLVCGPYGGEAEMPAGDPGTALPPLSVRFACCEGTTARSPAPRPCPHLRQHPVEAGGGGLAAPWGRRVDEEGLEVNHHQCHAALNDRGGTEGLMEALRSRCRGHPCCHRPHTSCLHPPMARRWRAHPPPRQRSAQPGCTSRWGLSQWRAVQA